MLDSKTEPPSYPPTPDRDAADIEPALFDGTGSAAFVRAMQKEGLNKGKLDDHKWVAHFASTLLDGEAMLWWATLDTETRGDWPTLCLALLKRFPPTRMMVPEKGELVVNSVSSTPAEEAETPPPPSGDEDRLTELQPGKIGRISASKPDGTFLGYSVAYRNRLTKDRARATRFHLSNAEPAELHVLLLGAGYETDPVPLGLQYWDGSSWTELVSEKIKSGAASGFVVVSEEAYANAKESGEELRTKVWRVDPSDNSISARWEGDEGGVHMPIQPVVSSASLPPVLGFRIIRDGHSEWFSSQRVVLRFEEMEIPARRAAQE